MDGNLTKRQLQAVLEKDKNVLVSASAGSGKTHVMIERIINLILNEGVNVENILAVTYTKLAASEMKQKLVKAIIKQLNDGIDVARMKRALLEIPTADVSTFHSFCLNLLRTYFYVAGVEPDFSIGEESQIKEISNSAINDVFLQLYESRDEDFLLLTKLFRANRSDSDLKEFILSLYEISRSEENPSAFIEKCANSVCEKNYEQYEKSLLQSYKFNLSFFLDKFDSLKILCSNYNSPLSKKIQLYLDSLYVKTHNCLSAQNLQQLRIATSASNSRFPTIKEENDEYVIKDELVDFKTNLTDTFKNCANAIPENRQTDLEKYLSTAKSIQTICRVCSLYSQKFALYKSQENLADFSDLEHITLKLLTENAEVLSAVREKYAYVFADEYQDVNGVQEAILQLIAKDNLFMVGDVKQSIYAFRGCNPEIFSNKYDYYESTNTGCAIPLDKNFRSSDGVLSLVNNIFSRVFTKDFSGVNYKENPMCRGGLFEENFGSSYLHVINKNEVDNQPIEGLYNLVEHAKNPFADEDFYEGELISKLIYEEIESGQIYDVKKKLYRKVNFSDIAVILRNSTGFSENVVNTLIENGIPVSSIGGKGIEVYPEIKLLINVLKLIEFYADDSTLASVLKSTIGGLDDNDLAKIRTFAISQNSTYNKKSFVFCVDLYTEKGDDCFIKQKLIEFKEYFNKIRVLSEFAGAGEILSRIIREKGLDLSFAVKPMGNVRIQRIERFIAESQPMGKQLSVSEFLIRLNNTKSISSSNASGEDAVNVLSMHASKGLEFPVVIIAGIHKKFNSMDDDEKVLFSRKDGLCVTCFDQANKKYSTSLAYTYFKDQAKRQRAKEEARVFYVALTRAQSKLHVVSSAEIDQTVSEQSAFTATKFKDFICKNDFEKVINYCYDDLKKTQRKTDFHMEESSLSKNLTSKIVNNLKYKYPYEIDTLLPVKDAVSSISSRQSTRQTNSFLPSEKIAESIDKAKIGTVYHKFMQLCDFKDKNANNQLIRLLMEEKMSNEEVELLDVNLLNKVLSNTVFDQLDGYNLYKEQQFITSFSARSLYGVDSDAEVLIQGVIDLLAIKGDKAIIIDYKVSSHTDEQLNKEYSKQLELYKMAVEKCLGITVEKTMILNLTKL